jgi:glycosyltransferase involved in cell wall biosynthesis
MKVLIVCSGNGGQISPFIQEQVDSIKRYGVECDYFNIIGKGIKGYFSNLKTLKNKINSSHPDLIHAHYGLSGLLSVLSKSHRPLIVTFHGNDINPLFPIKKKRINRNKLISRIVYLFNSHSIFVSEDLAKRLNAKSYKSDILPCGIDLDIFYPVDKMLARQKLSLSQSKTYVLFSSSFHTPIKNHRLAKEACLPFSNLELIELKGYNRQQVNLLLNASDLALITSWNEGSNQFLKEAMACNRPIVSTKVGDSEWVFGKTKGCYLTSFDPLDVAEKINLALDFGHNDLQTSGRERIIELGLDSMTISGRLLDIYRKVPKLDN